MENIVEKAKQNINTAAIKGKCKTMNLMTDIRGESQNTASAGGVIFSLVIIAAAVGFGTGFLQNTIFPWITTKFASISG